MIGELHPVAQEILERHFNIVDVIDVCHYGQHPNILLSRLSNAKKEVYEPNDRIILILGDHDYYLNGEGPGFQLYNVQLALSHLGIPNYFCLLLTSQSNYDDYTKIVQKQLTVDDIHIRSITTMLDTSLSCKVKQRNENKDQIEKAYCILSRQARSHRAYFLSKIFATNIQDHGVIGYNNLHYPPSDEIDPNGMDLENRDIGFLSQPTHLPPLLLHNEEDRQVFSEFTKSCPNYKNFVEQSDMIDNSIISSLDSMNPIQQALIYVGLETQHTLRKPFMSRISLRGVIEKRPFIIFGVPGILARLRSEGFKTFNDFWDESYDSETDLISRTNMIISILEKWSSMSIDSLRSAYDGMRDVIEHNHDYYHHGYINHQSLKLEQACRDNLQGS